MNIYHVIHVNMAGKFEAIVIAKDEGQALTIFENYFGDRVFKDFSDAIKIGTAKNNQKAQVVVSDYDRPD